MIITFSKDFVSRTGKDLEAFVIGVVDSLSAADYPLLKRKDGNLYAAITWSKGRRVRFTIETRDAWAHGSRVAASGRHMRKASWEAHRDVMRDLLTHDPDARIMTGFAVYRGLQHFEATHAQTAHKNVGSRMCPKTIRECSV